MIMRALEKGSREGVSPGLLGWSWGGVMKQGHARGVPDSHQPVRAALAAGVHSADDLSELRGRGAHVPARSGR